MTVQAVHAHSVSSTPPCHLSPHDPLASLLFDALRQSGTQRVGCDVGHWQQLAQQDYLLALETGHSRHFLAAADAFHKAECGCPIGSTRQRQLRQWVVNSFNQSRVLEDVGGSRLHLSGRGEALLIQPEPDRDRRHCLILLNDLHTFKEIELFRLALDVWRPSGISCLLIDGPGQGALAFDGPLPIEFEHIVQGAIHHLIAHRGMSQWGFSVLGLGLGGHLALRTASRLASIHCAINVGGPFDLVDALPNNPQLAETLALAYQPGHPDAMRRLSERELSLACLPAPQTPILNLHWDGPGFIPECEADKIDTWAGQCVDDFSWPGTSGGIVPALELARTWLLDRL